MIDNLVDERWIRRFHSGPDRPAILVCFPHAGGSATYFSALSGMLQSRAHLLAVQYPGRQDRRNERHLTTIAELADGAFTALEPVLKQPVALFGHSMGAMIAFEVANRMRSRLDASPVTLFVSGRRAPSRYREEDNVHLRDEPGLVAELKGLSGTDLRILDDPEVLEMILPSMRSDYAAVETYRYEPGPKLDCPVVGMIGEEDPKASVDEVRSWGDHTTGPFRLHAFSGGHFYLAEDWRAVADVIYQQLMAATT
ncbi:MAG: thioesterase [Catenulispora sp. 13_1_20CM_3_70_7]|nr:MAG: thioesterase [Catenulispora sp. 13_1_20CM_3_70_7]